MQLARALVILFIGGCSILAQPPRLVRVFPLGGQAGTTLSVEILGERLSNADRVEFDSPDIVWKSATFTSPHRLVGEVVLSGSAAPGLHRFRVLSLDGPSNSGLFQVGTLRSVLEAEPNDTPERAFPVSSFPADIQGRLDKAPDTDIFRITVKSGERLVFDLKSIEDGSAVEARMILLDSDGKEVAFNDDRDDYNENPRIDHIFEKAGTYYLKLDQYRGPRGFNFGKLCAYILRIGSLPIVRSIQPRALKLGQTQSLDLYGGTGLDSVEKVYLTEFRQAEYSRMTYPYTMPIHFRAEPHVASRLDGRVKRKAADLIDVTFDVPASARAGLWRVWLSGKYGLIDAGAVEITGWRVTPEDTARSAVLEPTQLLVAGSLDEINQKDAFELKVRAGQTIQIWTLAEQIGVPHLDSVLTLRDSSGRKLAENDDVVAGQGTLLGNPDSRLFYTPAEDGVLRVEVRDRTGRGGSGFEYCLKADVGRPGFQLFTTPENLTVAQGDKTELKVHLVREQGFSGEVDIWVEGLPKGAASTRGRFRADQLFEPNADGADMVIPELNVTITAAASMEAGEHVIRVFGAPAAEPGRTVEARSTLMLGPLLDAWNYVRRPLPAITMAVVAPSKAQLSAATRSVPIVQGGSATIELKAADIPAEASFRLLDLPAGVTYKTHREESKVTVLLNAETAAPAGTWEISAEAALPERRVPSGIMTLMIREQSAR